MSDTPSPRKGQLALDFKSATLYALRVVLQDHNTDALLAALERRMTDAGSFFEDEPVVVDASQLEQATDWAALIAALRSHSLHPVGVVAEGENLSAAKAAGLAAVDLANPVQRPVSTPAPDKDVPVVAPPAPGEGSRAIPEPAEAPAPAAALPELAPAAMVINRPLRSGQRIYARNTDLIVIGVVSQGAEVIADGNIHVYGPLRGKAMAGARGDTSARIFTTQLDPELLAIAGVYRVIETQLDDKLHNKPTIVQLDGDVLRITALGN
ncbi:septum site-determining protein MinC [Pollutimonas thiosulfatoxidans]|uniref:Probable septum site-determining protein MinC n=1 Tax=Pollutimonas thiosulfatoxidans TaxID=2028345 RepID=A0A410G8I8_9BURK|nr:septum site-determining protein MinC [Pollutimonas thiosulfatoxidans]QAA92607.1 septum site-determining protein MinC [Pollutimonas thiosulfatoxidans]